VYHSLRTKIKDASAAASSSTFRSQQKVKKINEDTVWSGGGVWQEIGESCLDRQWFVGQENMGTGNSTISVESCSSSTGVVDTKKT
jgi:hypothetical protein